MANLAPLLAPPVNMEEVTVFNLCVAGTTSKTYRRLMRARDRRKRNLSPRIIRGSPTTPIHESYHIVILRLPGRDEEVGLLFRDRDEYQVAVRNGQGVWFQFYDQPVPANFNPIRLRLRGSHTRMPDGPHWGTTVGHFTFRAAYNELVNFNALGYGVLQRRMLHACTLVFSEASRFRSIRWLVCYNMDNGINTVLSSLMWKRIFCWSHMSSWVLRRAQMLEAEQGEAQIDAWLAALGITCFIDAVGTPGGELLLLNYDAEFF
ncbi:hypothetical protein CFC21_025636 [Triticum aestivum]|uniref:rRNA N-glycosylase n=2 Tax=Triticum aestivum TaxID=4565 RepID=A0A9R1EKB6_WHEAT|nr:hypothetical protein CFC21_025636 [Triticum aestivum]